MRACASEASFDAEARHGHGTDDAFGARRARKRASRERERGLTPVTGDLFAERRVQGLEHHRNVAALADAPTFLEPHVEAEERRRTWGRDGDDLSLELR